MSENKKVDPLARDNRISIVLAPDLNKGQMANRAAVLATGLAARHPEIVGPDLQTADGQTINGITKVPIAVLAVKTNKDIADLVEKAATNQSTLVVYLSRAQGLRSYEEYTDSIAKDRFDQLDVDSLILYGPKKEVARMTGNLPLVR